MPAHAGIMELSASYSVRNSSIDENNYTKNESWSGSFAWYFLELSAIELSYTKGLAEQNLKSTTDTNPTKYYADFEMYGADLVITLAKKDSFLQPFVRGGMANIRKKFYKEYQGTITAYGDPINEVVPSYGAGLKLFITKTFSIKGSYDRWKSGSNDDKEIWDDAIKGGISWYF
jgi:hypothetical protein